MLGGNNGLVLVLKESIVYITDFEHGRQVDVVTAATPPSFNTDAFVTGRDIENKLGLLFLARYANSE